MEVTRTLELARLAEIQILQNVRLVYRHDLNPVYSKENMRVQFELNGDLQGHITCYLCLDGHELSSSEKDSLFPLFVEAMNILVGRQITLDDELSAFKIKLSAPRLSMISKEINTSLRGSTQKYELELNESTYTVLAEYSLEAMN